MPTPKLRFEISAEDKSQGAFDSVLKSAKTAVSALGAVGLGFGTAAAGVFAFTGIVSRAADDLGDFAGQIDISTEALTQYQFLGTQAGISNEKLNAGFQKMTRSVAEAAKGVGGARNAFRELGVDTKKLADLSPDQQFEVVAEALSKVEKQSDKARIAQQIFGRSGVELIRLTNDGAEGLRKQREEADKLGFSLGTTATEQFGKTADALDTFDAGLTAAGRIIAGYFAPAVEVLARGVGVLLPNAAKVAIGSLEQLKATLVKGAAAVASYFGADDTAAALADQASVYEINVAKIEEELKGYSSTVRDTTADVSKFIGEAQGPLAESAKAAAAALKLQNEEISKAKSYFDATRTSAEKFAATELELEQLFSKGRLTFEVYSRAGLQAAIAAEEAADAVNKSANAGADKKRADTLQRAAKYYDQTRTAAEKLETIERDLNELYDQRAISFEVYARAGLQAEIAAEEATMKTTGALDAAAKRSEALLKGIMSELEGTADDITDLFFGVKKSVLDVLEGLAESVAKLFFKQAVAAPIADFLTTAVKGFFPARAVGGPTFDRPTLVGERGPELITGAGNVVPNGAAGGAVNINFTVNSLDPRTAAAVIVANRDAIVGVVRGAFGRQGTAVKIA